MKKKKKIMKGERGASFSGLEQLFGSRTRFCLLKLFCSDSEREYFVRELARATDNQLNAVRREVANLESLGIIEGVNSPDSKKKFYKLKGDFILKKELQSLIAKSELLAESALIEAIKRMGSIDLCIATGVLVGVSAPCDMLLVGRIHKQNLAKIIERFEEEIGKSITYAIFAPEEYKNRKDLTDKFLFSVLESKKIVQIDKYGEFAHEA